MELVEQPHRGILALLDEACLAVGTVTDALFLASMDTRLGRHPHYSSRKVFLGLGGAKGGPRGLGLTPLCPPALPHRQDHGVQPRLPHQALRRRCHVWGQGGTTKKPWGGLGATEEFERAWGNIWDRGGAVGGPWLAVGPWRTTAGHGVLVSFGDLGVWVGTHGGPWGFGEPWGAMGM